MSNTYVVVGLGSMGKRRVRDLQKLNAGRIIGVDTRPEYAVEAGGKFGIETMTDLDAAMKTNPRALLISVPPHLHYPLCIKALDAGAAYFVECLTTLTMQHINDLIEREEANPGFAYVSTTKLFNEAFRYIAQNVRAMGKTYSIHTHIASWLPDQHPWEKQTGFHYEFHRAQGGGLAEPAFHLNWIYTTLRQRPVAITARVSHVSELPGSVHDLLDMIIEMDGGTQINFHYALCAKHDGSIATGVRFSCEHGTVMGDKKGARRFNFDSKQWEDYTLPVGYTHEQAYLAEMKHFLAGLDGDEPYAGSLHVERDVLATLLMAEKSSESAARIDIARFLQEQHVSSTAC